MLIPLLVTEPPPLNSLHMLFLLFQPRTFVGF